MKKVGLVLTAALTLSAGSLSVGSVSAAEPATQKVEAGADTAVANAVETITIVEEYDDNGNVINEEVVSTSGDLTLSDFGGTGALSNSSLSPGGASTFAVVIDSPNYDWKKIDTWKGNSKGLTKLSEWVYQFGAAVVPALISKNVWAASAGSATYNTFVKPPATRYYTNHVYQSQDYYYVYGRDISYEYSDSARTKKTKTLTHVYRATK